MKNIFVTIFVLIFFSKILATNVVDIEKGIVLTKKYRALIELSSDLRKLQLNDLKLQNAKVEWLQDDAYFSSNENKKALIFLLNLNEELILKIERIAEEEKGIDNYLNNFLSKCKANIESAKTIAFHYSDRDSYWGGEEEVEKKFELVIYNEQQVSFMRYDELNSIMKSLEKQKIEVLNKIKVGGGDESRTKLYNSLLNLDNENYIRLEMIKGIYQGLKVSLLTFGWLQDDQDIDSCLIKKELKRVIVDYNEQINKLKKILQAEEKSNYDLRSLDKDELNFLSEAYLLAETTMSIFNSRIVYWIPEKNVELKFNMINSCVLNIEQFKNEFGSIKAIDEKILLQYFYTDSIVQNMRKND